jgi:hypothetical protein
MQIDLQEMEKLVIKEATRRKDIKKLIKLFFPHLPEPTPTQQLIVRLIAFEEYKKITIKAFTRYGKSMWVGAGFALHKILHPGEKYRLVASLDEKTAILRNYIAEDITMCPKLVDLLEFGASGAERLKTEVSKKRLTFKDGAELSVHSAQGQALRLMGHGGTRLGVDETGEISKEVFESKIMRMLGDDPENCMIVEIGNPWDPNSHFAEHWEDTRKPNEGGWFKLHIPWQLGVKEGRTTVEFIEERRRKLATMPNMFKVLYEAEFPDEAEDQLIKKAGFEKACENSLQLMKDQREEAGVDVAEFGLDETVMFKGPTDGRATKVTGIFAWAKKGTMETVGRVTPKITRHTEIKVDATGVGSGVHSRLDELDYKAIAYKGGEKPTAKHEAGDFKNKLAQFYWQLHVMFEEGSLDLTILKQNPVVREKLRKQLMSIKYKIHSDRVIEIVKPDGKSPDYADALMIFCARLRKDIHWGGIGVKSR